MCVQGIEENLLKRQLVLFGAEGRQISVETGWLGLRRWLFHRLGGHQHSCCAATQADQHDSETQSGE